MTHSRTPNSGSADREVTCGPPRASAAAAKTYTAFRSLVFVLSRADASSGVTIDFGRAEGGGAVDGPESPEAEQNGPGSAPRRGVFGEEGQDVSDDELLERSTTVSPEVSCRCASAFPRA